MDQIKFTLGERGIDVSINGEAKAEIEVGHINSSILNPSNPITDDFMKDFQEYDDARVIYSGFCFEGCCSSTWVRIKETDKSFIFHDEYNSDYSEQSSQKRLYYEFDKVEYLKEVNRFLIGLSECFWKKNLEINMSHCNSIEEVKGDTETIIPEELTSKGRG